VESVSPVQRYAMNLQRDHNGRSRGIFFSLSIVDEVERKSRIWRYR